jgi:O-antigen/teichoic acid export membrane protein
VEGVYCVKTNAETLLSPHRHSLGQSFVGFYRKMTTSDFVQNVAETLVTRILLIGIGVITSVIVTRILGPHGRGLYAVALLVGAMGVQFGNLGLHASNTYSAARDRSLVPALVGNSVIISFAFGIIWSICAWAFFKSYPHWAPVQNPLLALALSYIPIGLAYMLLQNLLIGIQKVRTYNKIELVAAILNVGITCLLILLRAVYVETIFSSALIVMVISFLWVLFYLKKHLNFSFTSSYPLFKDNIRYGLKAYFAALFAFLVIRVDLLMVKYILGPEQAGYYSVAVGLGDLVFMLPVIIGTILFPKLSALSSRQERWKLTRTLTLLTALVMLILVASASVLAKSIIPLLYGLAFLPAVPAFQCLMPGIFFLGIEVVVVQFINSMGFPIHVVYIWGFSTLLNIAMNLYAIEKYGIIGAAIVSSISYLIVFALIIATVKRNRCESEKVTE